MPKLKSNVVFDFEKNFQELEEIVEKMEQGDSTLEVALDQFSRGVKLVQRCQSMLEKAEQRVQILLSKNQNDQLVPFVTTEEKRSKE